MPMLKSFLSYGGAWRMSRDIIVGTLNTGSPKCQIVGVLIIRFSEKQERNMNLNDLTS